MKMKAGAVLCLIFPLFSCQPKKSSDSEEKVDVRVPEKLLSSIPSNMASETTHIVSALTEHLINSVSKEIDINLKCEKKADKKLKITTNNCRIKIKTPPVKLSLKELFFNLAAGEIHLGRKKGEATIWVRAFEQPDQGLKTIEFCRLEGVEAGVGVTMGKGSWAPGYPNIEGMRAVLRKDSNAPDAAYKVIEGVFDVSYLGSYPSQDCNLSDDPV